MTAQNEEEMSGISWESCLRISEVAEVNEAICNFQEDATEDNCICMVREIVQAAIADETKAEIESLKRERAMLVEKFKELKSLPKMSGQTEIIEQALSVTEPQTTQWLDNVKAETLEEAAQWFEDYYGTDASEQVIQDIRSLAASKRKEQI